MGVPGTADYHYISNSFHKSLNVSGSTGGTGFSAIKITALGRPEILVGLNQSLGEGKRSLYQNCPCFRSVCLTVLKRQGDTTPRSDNLNACYKETYLAFQLFRSQYSKN